MRILTFLATSLLLSTLAAQEKKAPELELIRAIEKLSKSTAPEGQGAVEYGKMLSDQFSRWTMGSDKLETKESWVAGISDWFEDGWRVIDRKNQLKELTIRDSLAFVRRNVEETYLGPNGDKSAPSKAAVSEVWIKEDGWKLLRVEVTVL